MLDRLPRRPLMFLGRASLAPAVIGIVLLATSAAAAPADPDADLVFGQGGDFTTVTENKGGVSASSLFYPNGVAVDAAGNLYVADLVNNRVLEYDTPLTTDTVADRVFGQGGDFTTASPNKGGVSASGLGAPTAVAVDAAGNLYVADNSNSRVLMFADPLTSDTAADLVFGQAGDFTTNAANKDGISAASLNQPYGVTVGADGTVYVADRDNNRVLAYSDPLATDTVADLVFGQGGDFTTAAENKGGMSASSLNRPLGVAVDAAGNLYISEHYNFRVLEFDNPFATDTVADRVIGQGGSFTSNNCNSGEPDYAPSASSWCGTAGMAIDSAGGLYVSDLWNNRVLMFNNPITNDDVADHVFGQGGDFDDGEINYGGISASSMNYPTGVAVDAQGNVYIADLWNNRVVEYDAAPIADTDGDTVPDPVDNCPTWYNPDQSMPGWPVANSDSDCDGSSTAREGHTGTIPTAQCSSDNVANNESVDSWPPDFNDDQRVSLQDVLAMSPSYGATPTSPNWNPRFNLAGPWIGVINLQDILAVNDFWLQRCA